jgi:hypothetical protein
MCRSAGRNREEETVEDECRGGAVEKKSYHSMVVPTRLAITTRFSGVAHSPVAHHIAICLRLLQPTQRQPTGLAAGQANASRRRSRAATDSRAISRVPLQSEPSCTVHFRNGSNRPLRGGHSHRKLLLTMEAASRSPSTAKPHELPALLADRAQWQELRDQRRAEFLFELRRAAASAASPSFTPPLVSTRPRHPGFARKVPPVNEQHPDPIRIAPVHEDAGATLPAQGRSPGSASIAHQREHFTTAALDRSGRPPSCGWWSSSRRRVDAPARTCRHGSPR